MKNLIRIIVGFFLVFPAIVYSLLFPKYKGDVQKITWTNGLIKNVITAYRRYDTKSWIRRFLSILKNPLLVDQYINILLTKKQVRYLGKLTVNPFDLVPSHDVCVDHNHHRKRVEDYKNNLIVKSFSPIIVVDMKINDGHHRIAAMKEVGLKEVEVHYYTEKL